MKRLFIALAFLALVACQQNQGAIKTVSNQIQSTIPDRTDPERLQPTPSPTPIPAPVTISKPAQEPTTTVPVVVMPTRYSNRIIGPGVNVGIAGTYSDCTGKSPVGWAGAYFDSCNAPTWIMAHPTFFGAMNNWAIGTEVTYWDGNGIPHIAHIINSRVFPPGGTVWTASGWLHLQVCTDNTVGSNVRVLDAN